MSRAVGHFGTVLQAQSVPVRPRPRRAILPVKPRAITNPQIWSWNASQSSVVDRPYGTVSTCPEPSCACAATPELDIERRTKLAGTAPVYDQHVVISTGRSDWKSRIEDEGTVPGEERSAKSKLKQGLRAWIDNRGTQEATPGLGAGQREVNLARGLKKGLGRNGKWFDPMHTISVTNSSFEPPGHPPGATPTVSAFVWPAFQWVGGIEDTVAGHEQFIEGYLLNSNDASTESPLTTSRATKPVVLICSHNARDSRCGILGPLLQAEFVRQFQNLGLSNLCDSVGLCSHIGGHKWAGNLILYIPPGWTGQASSGEVPSALEGKGVWYGRVEPKHIEGLIKETILGGKVVEELCRGVV